MTPKTKMEWMAEKNRLLMAGREADVVVDQLGLTAPIDPLAIVRSEKPLLRAGGRDFGNRFDGKLEYNREKNCFLLFFNTKYDTTPGIHHPRTRFSISHELGHYFLDQHHAYLMRSQKPHPSKGEFRSDNLVEKEADSFAASILLPTRLARPLVNKHELSIDRISRISDHFNASFVSTMFRCVGLSDFPCAVVGIREGVVAWMFPSDSLIEAGIYPNKHFLPANAQEPWAEFSVGVGDRSASEGRVCDWFTTYDNDDLASVFVSEEYVPVQSMGTLLVLLTMDEQDVLCDDAEEEID